MNRRQFLKAVSAAGAVAFIDPVNIFVREALAAPKFFGLHPFIEAHPEAVFIKRTNVAQKTDAFAKRNEGLALAKEIFVKNDMP